jgi:carotenoid cleavage dioxygenase-like enzyme
MTFQVPQPFDDSPYLRGVFAPTLEERTIDKLEVIGQLPRDLNGTFVRNGANPKFTPKGRYHWFDGDGMVHAITFEDGQASYRNRFVRTAGLAHELEAGGPLFTGILEPIDLKNPLGPFKNTANTDLVFHAGKLLALWWQTGVPIALSVPDLATLGEERFGVDHRPGISAHPKVDAATGEMMFMAFGMRPPFLSYGVIDPEGRLAHFVPIPDVPGPRYQHDIAITEHFTILMDLPMFADPEMLKIGKSRVKFYRDKPARFGVIPRHGTTPRWFEAEPCYIYHTINAWEEGDEIVMIGCRIADPLVGDPNNPSSNLPIPTIGLQRLEPFMHEWRMNLATGKTTERRLSDVMSEFPRMDNRVLGRPSRFTYAPLVAHAETLSFYGVTKHDRQTESEQAFTYPKGTFGGEVVVCPRDGSNAEDDAYLVTFTIAEDAKESELYVWSAADFGEPIARAKIPARVPAGYHAYWVPLG